MFLLVFIYNLSIQSIQMSQYSAASYLHKSSLSVQCTLSYQYTENFSASSAKRTSRSHNNQLKWSKKQKPEKYGKTSLSDYHRYTKRCETALFSQEFSNHNHRVNIID